VIYPDLHRYGTQMQEKIPKGVIRSCQSKKDWQYNGQKKKDKSTNNDLQNITQKTKDGTIQILQKIGCELRCCRKESSNI